MKHKNILLVVFFLTLFVFQQVQAGETMPSNNPPQINPAPANVGILYNRVRFISDTMNGVHPKE